MSAGLTKPGLRKQFSNDWKKHYQVKIFRERGFERRVCKKCGRGFWTLDPSRKTCADSSCQSYDFIGSPRTKKRLGYVDTWKLFERFFKKNGHASIPRYPVIDRIRPDLFFTIASIQDFQRFDNGNMIFIYPENPLVVPQMCLRFGDISSVGVSGRHLTSFIMPGQHAFGYPKEGYFKDRCMELDFNFLTKEMGIPETEITYIEDIWTMPDFSAFGPCIEAMSLGLELVNHVFMQFQKSGNSYKDLDIKVNDTGWGHERLVWFSNGTQTMYDCIFGNMIEKMKRETGLKPNPETFMKYSKLAGALDMDEIKDPAAVRQRIAKSIGISVSELREQIEPMQALYAMADHTRTLLFAITDGGIPSNVGGGYNLRVLLRRMFSFMKQYGFSLDVMKPSEQHARFLKPMFPELREGLEPMAKILEIEKQRYEKTTKNARGIIARMIAKGERFDEKTMIQLYESHGINPEIVKEVTKKEIPPDIYLKITQGHEAKQETEEKKKIDLSGIPSTKFLFYTELRKLKFTAKVLKVLGNRVLLDKTAFYAEGGGQESDHGTLRSGKKSCKVYDVQKIGGVALHFVDKQIFRAGDTVTGEVDKERRDQLSKHHTAIHIINAAARKVLGTHIWQAGSGKSMEKAHLDITHYLPITEKERNEIEQEANRIVDMSLPVSVKWMPRHEAEKKYGLRLYQGGAVPGKEIRVVEIDSVDVEACGGIHRTNTKEVGRIIITGTERIQDGVDRITIKAGESAESYLEAGMKKISDIISFIKRDMHFIKLPEKFTKDLNPEMAMKQLKRSADIFSVPVSELENTAKRFCREIIDNYEEMNRIRKRLRLPQKELVDYLKSSEAKSIEEAFGIVFTVWKNQRKEIEKARIKLAKSEAQKLASRIKNKQLFEVLGFDRKVLIAVADELLSIKPDATIILSNQVGDVIGMTGNNNKDMNRIVGDLCARANGSGGGKKNFAQGKAELSKLLKLAKNII